MPESSSTPLDECDRFAAAIAHDLAAPLRHIREFTAILLEELESSLNNEQREFGRLVKTNVTLAETRLKDLRDYSQLVLKPHAFTDVDCNPILQEILETLSEKTALKKAMFQCDPLPVIQGNAEQIKLLFFHLLNNALTYTKPDRLPIVNVSAHKKDRQWLFTVSDNGIGINANFYEKIFLPFRRLHLEAEYPGSGIGLTLCRRIVTLHGGKLWVTSNSGEGSEFHFTVPA